MPMSRFAGGSEVISVPPTVTLPPSGVSNPATTFSNVVFPEPLGPRMVSSSPWATCSETWSSATTSPKRFPTPSMSRSADPLALKGGQPFFSIQAFQSSAALVPFSAYHASLTQNCWSRYAVGRNGFTFGSTKFSDSRLRPGYPSSEA